MWFKIYLIDRTSNKLIDLSKIAYVELKDKDNATVLKAKIPLAGGIGNGSLFIPTSVISGNYNVIAYTRWMGNFNSDFYFHQGLKIINPFMRLGDRSTLKNRLMTFSFFRKEEIWWLA